MNWKILLLFFGIILFAVGVYAQTASFVTHQNFRGDIRTLYGSNYQTYWPRLSDPSSCFAREDILIQVSPAGCQPTVVRSDLLGEQNVAVFCQLDALKINPLINIDQIRNIRFRSEYPEGVLGVGFHPARAALRSQRSLVGDPLINNIGYVVVVLKRNEVEETIPDFINFTLNAQVDYETVGGFGIGAAEFLLKEQSDEEFLSTGRNRQSFWQGRYFVRLDEANSNEAFVSIYEGDREISSVRIQRGGTSEEIYVPGLYCQAGLQVSYDGFVSAAATARISVDDDILEIHEGSRFLNNKCVVRTIETKGASLGEVEVACGSERAILRLGERNYSIGDQVLYSKDGTFDDNTLYSILEVKENNQFNISKDGGMTSFIVAISEIRPDSKDSLKEITYNGTIESHFNSAIENFERVADEYPFEKIPGEQDLEGEPYTGEEALKRAIDMSRRFGKQFTEARLIEKFIELYSGSDASGVYGSYTNRLSDLYVKDYSLAGVAVEVDSDVHNIVLLDFRISDIKPSAEMTWGVQTKTIDEKNSSIFDGIGKISLTRIEGPEEVQVTVTCSADKDSRSRSYTLVLGENLDEKPCGETLNLRKVNLEELAKIRLTPRVKGTATETNFTVGIGIEKRAIELNPDKAKQKIDQLNATIEKWERISETLGNVNKGLKAACFATAGALTVKNFFTGLSGEGLARQRVMKGYWSDECARLVSDEDYAAQKGVSYSSLDECYLDNADEINQDVGTMKGILQSTDEQIENSEVIVESSGLFSEDVVNANSSINNLRPHFEPHRDVQYDSNGNGEIDAGDETIGGLIDTTTYDRGDFSYDQYRELLLNAKLAESGDERLEAIGQENLNDIAKSIEVNRGVNERFQQDRESREAGEPVLSTYLPSKSAEGREKVVRYFDVVKKTSWDNANLPFQNTGGVTHYARAELQESEQLEGGSYVFALSESESGGFFIEGLAKETESGGTTTYTPIDTFKNGEAFDTSDLQTEYGIEDIKPRSDLSYSNRFIDPKVKFFETEPYKGYPAVVPFDIQNGWYAAVEQSLPIFGGRANVDSSGLPTSFWICNVGEDGREQFIENRGRDICQQINSYTGQSYDVFPNLPEDIARVKIQQGRNALVEAARQYSAGVRTVKIAGQSIPVGDPASAVPSSQCQEFMSPQECQLLFNVCDPVICPSSRCDFGGTYRVPDVIQSGIVGSALLCLPNAQEGIAIPVCLTGIQAGIDGYVSILKSHQQCLQENINSGRTVGICDLTTSIYTCDFFWRQAAPLADVFVPKLFEIASGKGGARGGGEYLSVQNAWDNTQQSVDFFTQHYAVNSLQAFRARSTAEAGSEFCRAWVSAKGPNSFESLIEPDSPVQFHAYFDSIKFNDATVPATAQYKVFYHIFAGRDQGAQYHVYLKDPPQVSFVTVPGTVQVASGFVSQGAFATDTVDFTAPEGYKQLCISINGREECGFKQVTTSFFFDAVKDEFASRELQRDDIKGADECVSGGTNPAALLNPNLQSGVEEAINPEVYNRGIVRICATHNPGTGTDLTRFVNVGYCGDQSVRCWLDTRSVDNAINAENLDVRNKTLTEVKGDIEKGLIDSGEILPEDEINLVYESLNGEVEKADRNSLQKYITLIDSTLAKTVHNYQKAGLIYLKGLFYEKVADDYRGETKPVVVAENPGKIDLGAPPDDELEESVGNSDVVNDETPSVYLAQEETVNGLPSQRVVIDGKPSLVYFSLDRWFIFKCNGEPEIIGETSEDGNVEIDMLKVGALDEVLFLPAELGEESVCENNEASPERADEVESDAVKLDGRPKPSLRPAQSNSRVTLNDDNQIYIDGEYTNFYLEDEFYRVSFTPGEIKGNYAIRRDGLANSISGLIAGGSIIFIDKNYEDLSVERRILSQYRLDIETKKFTPRKIEDEAKYNKEVSIKINEPGSSVREFVWTNEEGGAFGWFVKYQTPNLILYNAPLDVDESNHMGLEEDSIPGHFAIDDNDYFVEGLWHILQQLDQYDDYGNIRIFVQGNELGGFDLNSNGEMDNTGEMVVALDLALKEFGLTIY